MRDSGWKSGGMVLICVAGIVAVCIRAVNAAAPSEPRGAVYKWDQFYGLAGERSGRWYIVGAYGLLLSSADWGETWQRRVLAVDGSAGIDREPNLYSISFAPDRRRAWITGGEGLILRTDDGGRTWEQQSSPSRAELLQIVAVDAERAVAAGSDGALLYTSDAGQHWQGQKYKDFTFFGLSFVDENEGWAVGEFETVLHTRDGGRSWELQLGGKRAFTIEPYFAAVFKDAQHGVVAGLNGVLVTTNDRGGHWNKQKLPRQLALYAACVMPQVQKDRPVLWLAGAEGIVLRDDHAGVSPVEVPTLSPITAIAFVGRVGLAIGLGGTILKTSDSGEHWRRVGGG